MQCLSHTIALISKTTTLLLEDSASALNNNKLRSYNAFQVRRTSQGSHDSMTYCLDMNSPIVPSEPSILYYLDYLLPYLTRPEIYKWCTTQDFDVSQQLEAGIRYLDLRIAHKPKDSAEHLYFTHGIYTSITVQEGLTDIRTWLETHPKEVVILGCKNFEGMDKRKHRQLIMMMKNKFRSKICPQTSVEFITLRNLWASGFQVIISYEDAIAAEYRELWPSIPYWWANTYNPEQLIQFLDSHKQAGRPDGFFVAGINLTENVWYILTHLSSSLKSLTFSNYPLLTDWIEAQMPGPGKSCVNIIAGDFIEAAYLVRTVVELNNKLL
ncbi:PI-PLC X domain-containing protein 1-like [Callorhinchus milii]|uniref:PI-PLC X domain-containing protein 1 n=1 Tax=Callorhinchus milii TaxID=7868 RepID=K4G0G2_CALMI|nr:PI-PLC X domain-containing protein 1-like [Callorhinchus milii]AFK11211.1 PI-PLC X domain-containing protein 1 [Callorhinchus milii]